MKNILPFTILIFPLVSQAADLYRYVDRSGCELEKFVNHAWVNVDAADEKLEQAVSIVDADTVGYSNFKSNKSWYYAKKNCFEKIEAEKKPALPVVSENSEEKPIGEKKEEEKREEIESQEISDLHYFTAKGDYDLDIVSKINLSKTGTLDIDGTVDTIKVTGAEEEVALNYGVAKGVQIGILESYGDLSTTVTGTSVSELKERGFSDPTLLFGYRLSENEHQGLYADLNLAFQPTLIKSHEATGSEEGTLATGCHRFVLNPMVTFVGGRNEMRISPRVEFATSGKKDGGSITNKPFTQGWVNLTYRSHVNSKFFVSPYFEYHFAHSQPTTETSSTDRVTTQNRFSGSFVPGIDFGFFLSKKVLATVGYVYSSTDIDQSSVTTDLSTLADTESSIKTHLTAHVLSLGLKFEL